MIHLLYRASGATPDLLGAVTDPTDLATLQNDGDAIPVDAYLLPASDHVEDPVTGEIVCSLEGRFVRAPKFALAAWDAQRAALDASIAGLDAASRAELFPGHVPEADKKAARTAKAAAAKTAEEARAAAEVAAKAAADAALEAAIEARVAAAVAAATGKP